MGVAETGADAAAADGGFNGAGGCDAGDDMGANLGQRRRPRSAVGGGVLGRRGNRGGASGGTGRGGTG
jgi:hypothetical protein